MNLFLHHRDLRYHDNTTMIEQQKNETNITPLFIFDPIQINPKKNEYFSNNLVQFMIESLKDYNEELKDKNGELYFMYGTTLTVLKYIHKKIGINSLGFNIEYSPFGLKRDEEIKIWCKKNNITVYCEEDIVLFNILGDLTLNPNNNKPFLVYTAFFNYLIKLKPNEVDNFKDFEFKKNTELKALKYYFSDLDSLYTYNPDINVNGGRSNALKILKKINMEKFKDYSLKRDQLTYNTTFLSAYINLNVVSIREVYEAIINTFNKKHGLVRELIFRDFYHNIVYRFGYVINRNYYSWMDTIKWSTNKKYFDAWAYGKTGFPIIDAGMMQLLKTGYMHNRMRMLSASFLIKNLKINYREGEKWFAKHLVDYNIYSNWGGWTNIADAAPSAQSYFRVFSPLAHSLKYDKECIYIKTWLPELKDVPNKDIHYWETNYKKYTDIKYYPPIISFNDTRNEFIPFYKKFM